MQTVKACKCGILPWWYSSSLALGLAMLLAMPVFAAVPTKISVILDQAQSVDNQCQLLFVIDNSLPHDIERLQAEMVLFNAERRVLRMAVFDFQSVPEQAVRVRRFNLPNLACSSVDSVLFNSLTSCTPLDNEACNASLELSTKTSIRILR